MVADTALYSLMSAGPGASAVARAAATRAARLLACQTTHTGASVSKDISGTRYGIPS